MAKVLVFDLMGTLLDPTVLDPDFKAHFGSTGMRQIFFQKAYESMNVATITGEYRAFADHADAALRILSAMLDKPLSADERQSIVDKLGHLPPFAGVEEGLRKLKGEARLVALTNGSLQSSKKALQGGGLSDLFERVYSCDEVAQAKPGPKPYLHVAETLGLAPGELTMVAAHAFDVAGASSAGLRTVFLKRPGEVQNPLSPADREIRSLDELVP